MKSSPPTSRRLPGLVLGAALLAMSSPGWALLPYTQNFEGLNDADPNALGNNGWLAFGNVFTGGGVFKFGYGPFPTPTGGPGFSGIAVGLGDAAQGNKQLNVYSDYECCGPGTTNEGHFSGTELVESNVFQEQTINPGDVGATWTFTFDVKGNDIAPPTTAVAFIKTLDPNAGFALTNFLVSDTSSVAAWETRSLQITIDAGLVGQILQFGFNSTSSDFNPSSVLYDNISFSSPTAALLTEYSQDFEGLWLAGNQADALSGDGWNIFGAVFDSGGVFQFGYSYATPNGGEAFSGIVDSESDGPARGLAQLSVYNDYTCCDPPNQGHFNGTDVVEANVFQEQPIGFGDVGNTWTFQFDVKQGNIGGSSTAVAFIKTIDPGAGFAQTNFLNVNTTATGMAWTSDSISITIDAGLVGQLLQFGFQNTAKDFEPSQVVYDNISFSQVVAVDTDGDGITDDVDNCITFVNPSQLDSNGDGFGNQCDADLTGSCNVSFGDLSAFKAAFPPNPFQPDADFNENGFIDFGDLARLKQTFFNGATPGPGPSGQPNACP